MLDIIEVNIVAKERHNKHTDNFVNIMKSYGIKTTAFTKLLKKASG